MRSGRRRCLRLCPPPAPLAVGIAVLVCMGGLVVAPRWSPGFPPSPRNVPGIPTAASQGSSVMQQAIAALADGNGPAAGSPMSCTPSGGGYICSTRTAGPSIGAVSPSVTSPSPNFLPYNSTPSKRYGAVLAQFADPSANGTSSGVSALLFGGADAQGRVYNDTWEFKQGPASWLNVTPFLRCHAGSCPSARHDAAAGEYQVRDSYFGSVILFGGCTVASPSYSQSIPGCDSSASHILGDTWEYLDTTGIWGNWTRLSTSLSPSARYGAAMARGPTVLGAGLVMFGGCGVGSNCPLADSWQFKNGTWLNVTPSPPSPPARYGAALGFVKLQVGSDVDALFGGCGSSLPGCAGNGSSYAYNDTWIFDGYSWYELISEMNCSGYTTPPDIPLASGDIVVPPVACPPPRYYPGYTTATSGASSYLEITGGAGPGGVVFGNATDPGGYWSFGENRSTSSLGWLDLWTPIGTGGSVPAWTGPSPIGPPADRYDPMFLQGEDFGTLFFGGSSATGDSLGDTWYYATTASRSISGLDWPPPEPSPEYGGSISADWEDGYDVQFGGCGAQCGNVTTWTFASDRNGTTGSYMPWESLWPAVNSSNSPPARFNASMIAFNDSSDTVDDVVLFGGMTGGGSLLGDTWTFSGGTWAGPLSLTSSPSPRQGASFAYNATAKYAVLFGGCASSCPLNDTWELSYSFSAGAFTWNNKSPTHAPSPRWGGAMAYDPASTHVVLFGGCGTVCPLGDTWFYEDSGTPTWTQCTSSAQGCSGSGAPPARWGAALGTDSHDGLVVLFGGQGSSGVLGDTFVSGYPHRVWYGLNLSVAPPARVGGSIADDPRDGYSILTGGANLTGEPIGGLGWFFHKDPPPSGAYSWTSVAIENQIPNSSAPSPRFGGSLAFNSTGNYALLVGGCQDTKSGGCGPLAKSNDTWEFANGSWRLVCADCGPSPRWEAGLVFDPAADYFLLVGGCSTVSSACSTGTVQPDVWRFAGKAWTSLGPAPFRARGDMSLGWDAFDSVVVVFGGVGCSSACGDTWSYQAGAWHRQTGSGPSARAGAAFAYDANASDRWMVLFGGQQANGAILSDTWTFRLATGWLNVTNSSAPPARRDAGMTYDALDERLLLVGGENGGLAISDAWSFEGGNWSSAVTPLPSGEARWGMSMVFDPAAGPNGFVLLFGGSIGSAIPTGGSVVVGGLSPGQGDTWEYLGAPNPAWAPQWEDVSLFV